MRWLSSYQIRHRGKKKKKKQRLLSLFKEIPSDPVVVVVAATGDNHRRLFLATEVELDSTFWLLQSTSTYVV